ncbi:MAG: TPM domain-containing protein [Actinobacteria bacterium]|nr:TPM domain-containing protein [Actinomycetota bacterium]
MNFILSKIQNHKLIFFRICLFFLSILIMFIISSLYGVLSAQSQEEIKYPSYIGYVNDFADLLDEYWETNISYLISDVKEKTGCEIAVVTVTSLYGKSIEEYANGLFRYWGIGNKENDNGVLLIISTEGGEGNRDIRIEVGYGLEGAITDLESGRILREIVIPRLKEGNYGQGVYDGVTAIANEIYKDLGLAEISGASLSEEEVVSEETDSFNSGKPFFICFGIIFFIILISVVIRNILIRKCPKCKKLTIIRTVTVLEKPTYTSQGKSLVKRVCKNCGFSDAKEVKIPKLSRTSSTYRGGGFGGGGIGRSSGGFGGFGGGSSGGGGASGKW